MHFWSPLTVSYPWFLSCTLQCNTGVETCKMLSWISAQESVKRSSMQRHLACGNEGKRLN